MTASVKPKKVTIVHQCGSCIHVTSAAVKKLELEKKNAPCRSHFLRHGVKSGLLRWDLGQVNYDLPGVLISPSTTPSSDLSATSLSPLRTAWTLEWTRSWWTWPRSWKSRSWRWWTPPPGEWPVLLSQLLRLQLRAGKLWISNSTSTANVLHDSPALSSPAI